MHACEMYLSHVIHYQHVSTAVAVIIRVTNKITGSPNKLLKCNSEPLIIYRACLKLPT
jgi:hypothetical protein